MDNPDRFGPAARPRPRGAVPHRPGLATGTGAACGQQPATAVAAAAHVLNWTGQLVTDVRLFGTSVSAVVTIDDDAHAWRRAAGCDTAQLDPMTLAMWEWPEGRARSRRPS
jgi:hypothetical protein